MKGLQPSGAAMKNQCWYHKKIKRPESVKAAVFSY